MLAKKSAREKASFDFKVVDGEGRGHARGISVLADGCTFNGKMFLQGEARLSGKIEGIIVSNGVLIIEESAVVVGDVQGVKVLLCGKVEGSVKASQFLQLTSTCKVNGDLAAPRLVVDDGAQLNGRVSYIEETKKENQPALTAIKA